MSDLLGDLQGLLGDRAFIALTEAFGGTRLYVPPAIPAGHAIARAIGEQAADRLCRRMAPAVIRVPLARELRARHYRDAGQSFAEIAVKLGLTETGVQKLFDRMNDPPVKGARQLSFFK